MANDSEAPSAIDPNELQILSASGLPAKVPSWLQLDDSWGSPAGVALIVLDLGDEVAAGLVEKLAESATVLVCGWSGPTSWRDRALQAGAFGCISDTTPEEDRNGLIFAAFRHQAARAEYKTLREHHDRLCMELVTSFGEAMDRLSTVREEVRTESSALEEIRLRILRALV